MKTTTLLTMAGIALLLPAQAGTTYTAPAPAPAVGIWEWFAGGSVGYLTDQEEVMYTLHAGMEYKNPNHSGTHALYLEVGFTQDDTSHHYSPPPYMTGGRIENADLDLDIYPITLNYKYEAPLTSCLNYYLGLGLGIAIIDSCYDWSWTQGSVAPPYNHGGGSDSQSDTRFYGHVFAGMSYDVSDSFEIFGGVKYIFMDDVDWKTEVRGESDYSMGIDDDFLIELGARYHF